LVQILLYGGAVTILVIFALMLTRARESRAKLQGAQWPFGLVAAAGLGAVLLLMFHKTVWPGNTNTVTAAGIERIGIALFNDYALPFEIASLVLLVALIGAIVIARSEES
jgi:NADH:ubiquinone oxidoreductase subunit 6 (subunit J)